MNPETQALIEASKQLGNISIQLCRENMPTVVCRIVWHAQDHVDKMLAKELGRVN